MNKAATNVQERTRGNHQRRQSRNAVSRKKTAASSAASGTTMPSVTTAAASQGEAGPGPATGMVIELAIPRSGPTLSTEASSGRRIHKMPSGTREKKQGTSQDAPPRSR